MNHQKFNYGGQKMTVKDLANELGISATVLHQNKRYLEFITETLQEDSTIHAKKQKIYTNLPENLADLIWPNYCDTLQWDALKQKYV